MITYATLEAYKKKCDDALNKVQATIEEYRTQIETLNDQEKVISGQLFVLEELMDTEKNPPVVELPGAGDKIEEEFEKRLEFFEGVEEDDFYKKRQEITYKREAMDTVNSIDAINNGESTQQEPEGDS